MMRAARPDPEVRRLLWQLALAGPIGGGRDASVARVRRQWQLAVRAFASRPAVHRVTPLRIPGAGGPVALRAYRPTGPGPFPVLVWLHGGGFVVGDLYTAGATARALAAAAGVVVVTVDYRLAPEHPLEAGYADARAAVHWLAAHAGDVDGDPARLLVGGDSAGGGFAALLAQECARTGPRLAGQLLAYPATDLTGGHAAAAPVPAGPLTRARLDWFRDRIRTVTDLADPRWSALPALRDGPPPAPAVLLTAGYDPLCAEGLAYVRALAAAGVPVRHLHYPGQIHGFLALDRVLAGGRDALRRLGDELAALADGRLRPGVQDDLPPGRRVDRLLWLAPAQRWHELTVAAQLVADHCPTRGRTADRS